MFDKVTFFIFFHSQSSFQLAPWRRLNLSCRVFVPALSQASTHNRGHIAPRSIKSQSSRRSVRKRISSGSCYTLPPSRRSRAKTGNVRFCRATREENHRKERSTYAISKLRVRAYDQKSILRALWHHPWSVYRNPKVWVLWCFHQSISTMCGSTFTTFSTAEKTRKCAFLPIYKRREKYKPPSTFSCCLVCQSDMFPKSPEF